MYVVIVVQSSGEEQFTALSSMFQREKREFWAPSTLSGCSKREREREHHPLVAFALRSSFTLPHTFTTIQRRKRREERGGKELPNQSHIDDEVLWLCLL